MYSNILQHQIELLTVCIMGLPADTPKLTVQGPICQDLYSLQHQLLINIANTLLYNHCTKHTEYWYQVQGVQNYRTPLNISITIEFFIKSSMILRGNLCSSLEIFVDGLQLGQIEVNFCFLNEILRKYWDDLFLYFLVKKYSTSILILSFKTK